MCAALVGGMDRLKREYINTAKDQGITLKVFTGQESNISQRLGDVDMVIIFTNKVSHEAKKKAFKIAKTQNIPLQLLHACGVSTLSEHLREITVAGKPSVNSPVKRT